MSHPQRVQIDATSVASLQVACRFCSGLAKRFRPTVGAGRMDRNGFADPQHELVYCREGGCPIRSAAQIDATSVASLRVACRFCSGLAKRFRPTISAGRMARNGFADPQHELVYCREGGCPIRSAAQIDATGVASCRFCSGLAKRFRPTVRAGRMDRNGFADPQHELVFAERADVPSAARPDRRDWRRIATSGLPVS
jgi:ribosomal protein L35